MGSDMKTHRCGECVLTARLVPLFAGEDAPDCICGDRPDGRIMWSDGVEGAAFCAWCWRQWRIEHADHNDTVEG